MTNTVYDQVEKQFARKHSQSGTVMLKLRQQAKGSKSTSLVPLMLQPAAVALLALTPLPLAPPIYHAPADTKLLL